MGPGRTMRSFIQDSSVKRHKLASDTPRRILRFARPFRTWIAVFLAVVVLDAFVGAATPWLYRDIIDRGIASGRKDLVVAMAVGVALLGVLSAALALVMRWLSGRIGEGLIYNLRTAVFDHVQSLPVAFFSRTQTGSLIQRLNGDVMGAQQAFTSTLSTVVSNALSVLLVLAAMLWMSWQITLLSLALLPLFLLPARLLAPRLRVVTIESYKNNAEMAQMMSERFNVGGAVIAKVFGRSRDDSRVFAEKAGRIRDIGITQANYSGIFRVSLALLSTLAIALVYGLGGVFVISRSLGVGTLVALAAYLTRLYGPLTALSNVQVDIMTTLVSFERVLEVLDLTPGVADRADALALPREADPSIEFDHVFFHYPAASEVSLASLESVATLSTEGGGQVLENVSFRVESGKMVALVGRSGAGKTTITALVPRLYDATEGSVRVGGYDVRELTQESLRAFIGVVTQDSHLYHESIRTNLRLARPGATDADLEQALRAAQIWDLIASLPEGLDTVVGDRGYRLSGGERQRLAIARVLLMSPAIVILDEATAHLDSESEAAVQLALSTALEGRTSLVIAHRLSTVRQADEILVLDEGRLVERGSHSELLQADRLYAELYRIQFNPSDAPSQSPVEAPSAPLCLPV